MALVTAAQFQTTPNVLGAIAGGQEIRAAEQAIDIQGQEAKSAKAKSLMEQKTNALARAALGIDGQLSPVTTGFNPAANKNAALMQLAAADPDRFESVNKALGLFSQQQKDEAGDFAFQLQNIPFEQRQSLIQERANVLQSQGRDATGTLELIGMDEDSQNAALRAVEISTLPAEKRIELMSGPELTTLQKNIAAAGFEPGTPQFQSELLKSLRKPTGTTVEVGLGGVPLTPEAQIELAAATKSAEKEAEVRAKSRSERESSDIESGSEAARVIPVFNRSLELLNEVKTGGIAGAALKAKQFLGVESASEGELINALNQQVLMQLKPIFGAQFTKAEGDWLKAIEASEGKSTEANRRLLERGLTLAKKRVEVGIKAATKAKDFRAAQEMQDFIDFDLGVADKNAKEKTDEELTKSLGL